MLAINFRRPSLRIFYLHSLTQVPALIRHWEVTARVHTDFSFVFLAFLLICSILFSFLRTRDEHVWASWGLRQARASSCECVSLLDRETGPDLTWQWTLAVLVCAALARVFKKRK